MSLAEIEIRPAGAAPGRLAAYGGLLSEVFGPSPKFSEPALNWRYHDNPVGQVVGADAWVGEALAAHYVTCPMTAMIEGRPARGLLSLNTATRADHQGKGLFTRLAEATYEAGAAGGYQFIMGVANANSTPGFVRKLGFQLVAPLAAGAVLRGPRRLSSEVPQFSIGWTPESLDWRLANPAGRYRKALRGEVLTVWTKTQTPFVECVAFLPPMADGDDAPPLAASLFIGLEPRLDLGRQGFVSLPDRLRPSPLNLIYRRLDPSLPEALSPGDVAINFLDFDPY